MGGFGGAAQIMAGLGVAVGREVEGEEVEEVSGEYGDEFGSGVG